jgi:predicted permease
MNALALDLRLALRSLRRSPLFTAVALLSLAVGIGANAAIFGLLDQVILRRLPVGAPGRLVLLSASEPNPGHTESSYTDDSICFSYPLFRDLRDRRPAGVFDGVLARFPVAASVAWGAKSERADAELVTGDYFSVLGVGTVLGRPLAPEDDRPGAPPVVLLSHGAWHRRFGGDPRVLGRALRVNGRPFAVAGVVEPGFKSVATGEAPELFVPIVHKGVMTPRWHDLEDRRSSWANVLARLAPGVSRARAETAVAPLFRGILESELPTLGRGSPTAGRFLARHLSLLPGERGISGVRDQFGKPLVVLMGMVALLLLIACANLAGLLVARAAARQREIAVRLALGAGRGRLVRQLLVESGLLALGGGALGLAFATWGARLLLRLVPASYGLGSAIAVAPDGRVLLFTLAVALLTGLAFGLLPALQATRPGLGSVLRTQGAAAEPGEVRLRKALVVAQVAVSLVLLLGALVFSRSLANLRRLDPGFRPDHLTTFSLDASLNAYREPAMRALYARVAEEVAGLPGVAAVSFAEIGVLTNSEATSNFTFEGTGHAGEDVRISQNWVAPGFLSTLGVPLLAGREVTAADREGGQRVAVVNETLARKVYGNASPLGRRLGRGSGPGTKIDTTIVGVVRDGKYDNLRNGGQPFLYFPYAQKPRNLGPATFYARTAAASPGLPRAIAAAVRRLDPDLPVAETKTMEEQVDESIFLDRAVSTLARFFGAFALVLAGLGLYGVMAYVVTRRAREIGIRMALGADRPAVLRLVLAEVAVLLVAGVVVAVPASLPLGRWVSHQVYGVGVTDPATIATLAVVMVGVGLAAGYLPARRAAGMDPLSALKEE